MEHKIKFTIIDYMHPELSFEEAEVKKLGIKFSHYQLRNAPPEEILKAAADADVILIDQAQFDRQVIEGLAKCKLLLRHGIGYDNVDIKACTENGIVVGYYPTYCVRDVAEQTVMLIMACQRKLTSQIDNLMRVDQGGFKDMVNVTPIYRLEKKTIGIVGFGNIGKTVLNILQGFGVDFLIHDPYLPDETRKVLGERLCDLDRLLRESDVVTVHVPLKNTLRDTLYMFDETQFKQMKSTAIFINTSRGPVVNLNALDRALREGWIAGAGIDVFEKEPPDSSLPLLNNKHAICTPHLSWFSYESTWFIRRSYMEDVRRFLNNKLPSYQVNPDVATYRITNQDN